MIIRLHLTWVVLSVALLGCYCRDAPLAADSAEPNDSVSQATPINRVFAGTMNEGETPDVFKFSASSNQRVTIEISEIPGAKTSYLDFRVVITAPDNTTVLTRERPLTRNPGALEFVAPIDGEYFIELKGVYTGPADALCLVGRLRYQLSVAAN
jgi:hypothetical protein